MDRILPLRTLIALAIGIGSFAAQADVTTEWVAIALSSTHDARQSAQAAAPGLRAVQEAASAAASAAKDRHSGRNEAPRAAAERHDAAVAVAAFAILEHLYPEQRDGLEWHLAVTFSRIPETAAKAEGAAIGRKVANEIWAARALAAVDR